MKDAKGHGSDPRGSHSEGVQRVGRLNPYTIQKRPLGNYWVKTKGAKFPLSDHATKIEAKQRMKELLEHDARYRELLG